MNNINFNAAYQNQISNPELQKRLENQENFTALDKEKLKQDTAEFATKAKENIEENKLFKYMRNTFGVEDPKKKLISIGLSIATVIGVAIAGNKLHLPAINLGNKIDGKLGSWTTGLSKTTSKFTDPAKKWLNNLNVVKNVKTAMEKPLDAIWNFTRGLVNGAKGLFSQTLMDELSYAKVDNETQLLSDLTKLFNGDNKLAKNLIDNLGNDGSSKIKLMDQFLDNIAKSNGCETTSKEFIEICKKIDNGDFGNSFINIVMKDRGKSNIFQRLVGDWWPANFIDWLTGGKSKILKGQLGDSLLKYGAIRGKLAKTLPAKIVQIIPSLVGDNISNFVNDKSGMGVFLAANLVGKFDNLQETPNDKKVQTILNETTSDALGWLIASPLAYSSIYTMVTLGKNLPSKAGFATSALKTMGKIVGFGYGSSNKLASTVGGLGRFAFGFMVVLPFINKQIGNLCNAIFGKPYDKNEELKKQQQEAQLNQVIPELGITQAELINKINNNPQALQQIQQNPQLAQKLQQNPKLLLDLLDGKDIANIQNTQHTMSPANAQLINARKNQMANNSVNNPAQMQADLFSKPKAKEPATPKSTSYDTATYIPSSAFIAKSTTYSNEKLEQINAMQAKADKTLRRAEKLISGDFS